MCIDNIFIGGTLLKEASLLGPLSQVPWEWEGTLRLDLDVPQYFLLM